MLNITLKNPQFNFGGAFVFAYIKNALGKTFGNLDDVMIKLSGITFTSVFSTKDQMVDGLINRYTDLAK